MPFHRRQRFAHSGSEFAHDLTESVQDIFSPRHLHLLLINRGARVAVPRTQAQDILASKAGDRAFQDHGTCRSLANLLSHARRQPRLLRLSYQSQLLLDLPVRNQAEERRLLKLHGQALAQRVVKHRVAGLVIELREDNRVPVGEFGSRRGIAM